MVRGKPKRIAEPPAWMVEGAIVDYHSIIGGPITQPGMVVRAGPQLMCGHWSVWLKGKAGSVAVEACTAPPYDLAWDRAIIDAAREGATDWDELALGEEYDFGEASRGKPNGALVHDVLTEPIEGAPMFERCRPVHAAFVIAAWNRWPAAVREIERLRAELEELRRG